MFTDFKRANFEFWKSRIREILAEKVYFWAFKRAKSAKLDFGAFQALKLRLQTKNSIFESKSKNWRVSARFESDGHFDITIVKNASFLI